jgi:hypothetical protein
MCICSVKLRAQYDGLDTNRRQSKDIQKVNDDYREKIAYSDMSIHGIDLLFDPISYSLTFEANPYTGIHFRERIYLCAGAFGAVYSLGNQVYTTYGANAFLRIPVNKFFLHGEYRIQNGITMPFYKREWYKVPIVGIGYMYGEEMESYALFGLAISDKYSFINPLGAIVFRVGFRFLSSPEKS